jgi:TP901 family phage tail tape measure protein
MAINTDEIKILVKAETGKALKNLKAIQNQSKKTAFSFNDIIKGAVGFNGVTTAINLVGTAMKDAVKTVINFDSAIANAASVSKVTRQELRELALEAGRNTKFSATEAADALFFLGSAGIETAEIMEQTLIPSLDLAAAANLGIAETTDIVVNNMKVFQKEGIQAAEVADIIAQTQRSANTDFRQLAEALKVAGADAALSGIKFKDLNLLIAGLANQGIKGSEAGIKLRQTFVRLRGGISSVDKTLAKYGITAAQINKILGEEDGAIKLLETLRAANISNEDATKIFGVRQGAVFALIKNGIGDVRRLKEEIIGTGEAYKGAAKDIADQKLDTIAGQIDLIKSAWNDVILVISGDAGIAEAFKESAKLVVEFIRKIGEIVRLKPVINGIRFVLDLIILNFKALISVAKLFVRFALIGFEPLVTVWEFIGRVILAVGQYLISIKDRFLDFVRGVIDFSKRIIKPLTAPFIVLAKVIAGLVKRFVEPFFDAILEGVKVVLKSVLKFGQEVQNFLGDKTPKFIQDGLKRLGKITQTTFKNMGNRLKSNVQGIGREVKNFTTDAIRSVKNLFDFSDKKSEENKKKSINNQKAITSNLKGEVGKRGAAAKEESDDFQRAFTAAVDKVRGALDKLAETGDENASQFINNFQRITDAALRSSNIIEGVVRVGIAAAESIVDSLVRNARTVTELTIDNYEQTITQIEKIELERSRQRIAMLEMEKQVALSNIDAESEAAKELTKILAAEEQERFNNLSEEEKKKELLRQEIQRQKEAEEAAFNKKIRNEKKRMFFLERDLAINQVKFETAKMIMDIERQFWAPWDGDKRRQLSGRALSLQNQQISLINSRIPSFRGGVENFPGGLAKVHGDELLVNMPPGTDVIPASQASQFASTNTTQTLTIGQVVMHEVQDARAMLKQLTDLAEDFDLNLTARN